MSTGFRRGPNAVTGMSDPSGGVTPEHAAEMQENIRKLEARLAVLEGRSVEVPPAAERVRLPIFEGRDGVNVVQTPRRVTISRARDDRAILNAAPFIEHLWRLYQKSDEIGTLDVSMLSGKVIGTNASTLGPAIFAVDSAAVTVTDDATTRFWVKVSVAASVYDTDFTVWAVTAAVREHGATVPTNTLDIAAGTNGDLFFEIGSVVAADGVVTQINPVLRDPVTVVFPLFVEYDLTEITVVTAVQIDTATRTVQIKTRTAKVYDPGTESAWMTIHTGSECP